LDLRVVGQRPRQLDDIQGLTSGIRVPSQLERFASDETVDADECQIEAAVVLVVDRFLAL
jgi:hypothetical protein